MRLTTKNATVDSFLELVKKESELKYKLGISLGSVDTQLFSTFIKSFVAVDVDGSTPNRTIFQDLLLHFTEKYLHKYPDISFHLLSTIHNSVLPTDSSLPLDKKKRLIKNIYQILEKTKLPSKGSKIPMESLFVPDGVSLDETIEEESEEINQKDSTLDDILFEGTSIYETEIQKNRKRKLELKNKKSVKQKKLKRNRVCDFRSYQKAFSDAYLLFLKEDIPLDIYKKLLFKLPTDVIPNLTAPFLLHDFLIESYKKGIYHLEIVT